MAGSNWDSFAVSISNGRAIDTLGWARAKSPAGVVVEIYKNWVYVNDRRLTKGKNDIYAGDTVAQIQHGSMSYADWHIEATRGPQDGIYVIAWSLRRRRNGDAGMIVGFVGCGVYGFEKNKWVGVLPRSLTFLRRWVRGIEDHDDSALPDAARNVKIPVRRPKPSAVIA